MSRSAWMWRSLGMALGLGLVVAELSCAGSVDVVSKGVKSVFAGYWAETSTKDVACYWEGTSRVDLPGGTGATSTQAYSPAISTLGNIYTPGSWSDSTKTHACYWTGSTLTTLASGTKDVNSYATGLVLEGSTIYVGGFYTTTDDPALNIPCYWKGGVRYDLQASGPSSRVTGISVSDSTVYCSGYYAVDATTTAACYWKGTTRYTLKLHDGTTDATNAKAYGIVYTNGDVYTVGHYMEGAKSVPCFWRNTKAYLLPGSSTTVTAVDANAIALSGSGSYLFFAGYLNDGTRNVPCYWDVAISSDTPSNPQSLGDGTHDAKACALFTSGNDLWIGGNYTNSVSIPCYWKGTASTKQDLAGNGTGNAQIAYGPN